MFCREQAAQLRPHREALRAAGGRVAFVGLGDERLARGFRDEVVPGEMVLLDPDREAYGAAALGSMSILDLFRPSMWRDAFRARGAGHRQGRNGPHPFQMGGVFVIGRGGDLRFARRYERAGEELPVAEILAAVGAID